MLSGNSSFIATYCSGNFSPMGDNAHERITVAVDGGLLLASNAGTAELRAELKCC